MLTLRSPDDAVRVVDPRIRRLVELRLAQVCAGEPYDVDRHGCMVVVEPGDTLEDLERVTGLALLSDAFGEFRYGDVDFVPAAEVIEDHGSCFELVFVLSDDGYAITLVVPHTEGVDPELLAMCKEHAIPSEVPSEP